MDKIMEKMNGKEMIDIKLKKGGLCRVYRKYLDQIEATTLFDELVETMTWSQSELIMYGKKLKTPRFQCWMGNDNVGADVYSKTRLEWTNKLLDLKSQIQQDTNFEFNYLLLNYYKTGDHYIGYHSDNEVLSPDDYIVSISLGGDRRFLVREKSVKEDRTDEKYEIVLNSGDLMIMDGTMQKFYKHSVPKTTQKVLPRINLTFRKAKITKINNNIEKTKKQECNPATITQKIPIKHKIPM